MADEFDPLIDMYCRGKNGRNNAALCAILIRAARDGELSPSDKPSRNRKAGFRAPISVYEAGEDYKRLGNFEAAAQWYERFVAASPEMSEAPHALHQAIVLRLGSFQEDRAQEDANVFANRYGSTRPALAAEINLAMARYFVGE